MEEVEVEVLIPFNLGNKVFTKEGDKMMLEINHAKLLESKDAVKILKAKKKATKKKAKKKAK
tara:strand:- start:506 stop:691 length:186 start_codon:yes stop_codon:yes gene_type:complete